MASEPARLEAARSRAARLEQIVAYLHEKYAAYPQYAYELSAPFVERLQRERATIDDVVGIPALSGADAILHVRSRDSTEDGPRASLIVDTISDFRSALTRVTLRLVGHSRPGSGRLPEELRKATDFRIVGFAAGSVKIGVRLDRVPSQTVLPGGTPHPSLEEGVWKAVELLREAATALGDEAQAGAVERLIPDQDLRGTVLRELYRMSPTSRGRVSSISLEGGPSSGVEPVLITQTTGLRALSILYPGSETELFDDIGTLRAVDVDLDLPKHLFVLRNRPGGRPDVAGDFDETLRFAVMDAVDKAHLVRVRGILERPRARRGKPVVHIESIELA